MLLDDNAVQFCHTPAQTKGGKESSTLAKKNRGAFFVDTDTFLDGRARYCDFEKKSYGFAYDGLNRLYQRKGSLRKKGGKQISAIQVHANRQLRASRARTIQRKIAHPQ